MERASGKQCSRSRNQKRVSDELCIKGRRKDSEDLVTVCILFVIGLQGGLQGGRWKLVRVSLCVRHKRR